MLQQVGGVKRRQGHRQPDAPLAQDRVQQIVLQGGQGGPPLAANTVLISATRWRPFGQVLMERGETHHLRWLAWLRRPTEAQKPRQTKLTSIAERP